MMTGYDAYVTYLSFKLHFSSNSYDFFKFNGKTNVNPKTFESRKDRYHFDKISSRITRESFIERMLVEYIDNQNFWIKDILTPDNKSRHLAWRGYVEGFEYNFRSELSKIREYCLLNEIYTKDLLKTKGVTHPLIFKMYLRKDIRIETFICVDNLLGLSKIMSTKPRDPIWEDYNTLSVKYFPFIRSFLPERESIKKIFIDSFNFD